MELTQKEREMLRESLGLTRAIVTSDGEVHGIKDGKRIFIAWSEDEARKQYL